MNELRARYESVRAATERLCAPLEVEDLVVQSMPDASPAKWHLAHTTWFFERFVLRRDGGEPHHALYDFLFNSYYEAVGARHPRPSRGLLSRPTVTEVMSYRHAIDERMAEVLERPALADTIELGLHHEQQHQELLLTDVKHMLSLNPLRPAYGAAAPAASDARPLAWCGFDGRQAWIGHGGEGFSFDNERPRHEALVAPFELADRLATAGEVAAFIDDGGYERPELWLSDGWTVARERGWRVPLYWERDGGRWRIFTLGGMRPLVASEPACHLSYYEADAFACWSRARLPREEEWELAAGAREVDGNFVESGTLHPRPASAAEHAPRQLFGDCWEWTASPYVAYPGFRPLAGALGEYNGKFMCNQLVLRGGSCATPRDHVRATYRNFFPPDARWQFTGVRLARDAT
jgi:ergothioneine biosynthesis protein EgtB